jgi:hypothetical protein
MSRPEIWLQVKIDFYADNLYTIFGVLKSKDKCNLISLYKLIAFFVALLA